MKENLHVYHIHHKKTVEKAWKKMLLIQCQVHLHWENLHAHRNDNNHIFDISLVNHIQISLTTGFIVINSKGQKEP